MSKLLLFTYLLLFGAFAPAYLSASPITYTPVNPSFGGNPFASAHLIGLADTQKQFDAPASAPRNPIEDFARTVQSSLLSRVSRDIADAIVGEDAQESGRFVVGDTVLEFEQVDGQVVIQIDDVSTGGSTTIEVPITEF